MFWKKGQKAPKKKGLKAPVKTKVTVKARPSAVRVKATAPRTAPKKVARTAAKAARPSPKAAKGKGAELAPRKVPKLPRRPGEFACPDCGSTFFTRDESRGEMICKNCGLVLEEESVTTAPEWRAFDIEQQFRRTRTGAPLTFTKHDKGISTEIGKGVGELYKVPVKKRAQYYRLRKWNKRLTKSKDRNLSYSLSELARQVSYLGLPRSVHEEVGRLYEKAVTKGLVRGRSMESIITALIYAVAREHGTPRTLAELSAASGIEKREIGRAYRYVARELAIRILPATAEEYIPRFASLLGLTGPVQARAKEILKKALDEDITSGKGPTGVAAAALYIAAVLLGERRTQRDIADVVGVTEVTIRNRYKDLVQKLGIEEEVERKAALIEKEAAEAAS